MAIGTDRNQIFCRVYLIFISNGRNWYYMMNMDKTISYITIYLLEIHSTDATCTAMNFETIVSGFLVTFITININLLQSALKISIWLVIFIIIAGTILKYRQYIVQQFTFWFPWPNQIPFEIMFP